MRVKIKRMISKILLIVIILLMVFNLHNIAADRNPSQENLGRAIGSFASNFYSAYAGTNRVQEIPTNGIDIFRMEAYYEGGTKEEPGKLGSVETYYFDAVGFVNYVIHQATGLDDDTGNSNPSNGRACFIDTGKYFTRVTRDVFEIVDDAERSKEEKQAEIDEIQREIEDLEREQESLEAEQDDLIDDYNDCLDEIAYEESRYDPDWDYIDYLYDQLDEILDRQDENREAILDILDAWQEAQEKKYDLEQELQQDFDVMDKLNADEILKPGDILVDNSGKQRHLSIYVGFGDIVDFREGNGLTYTWISDYSAGWYKAFYEEEDPDKEYTEIYRVKDNISVSDLNGNSIYDSESTVTGSGDVNITDGWYIFYPDGTGYFCNTTIRRTVDYDGNPSSTAYNPVFCTAMGHWLKNGTAYYKYNPCSISEQYNRITGNQDAMYILAFSNNLNHIQSGIWQSGLDNVASTGGRWSETDIRNLESPYYSQATLDSFINSELVADAKQYQDFHDNKLKDGFQCEDLTVYPEEGVESTEDTLKVLVDQDEDTFLVGKFKLKYTQHGANQIDAESLNHDWDDPEDTTKKFSYITNITLKNQDGEDLEILDIITPEGESISSREYYKYPYSEEEFYIKFKDDGSGKTTGVSMNAEFKYLSECYAELHEWLGSGYGVVAEDEETGSSDDHYGTVISDADPQRLDEIIVNISEEGWKHIREEYGYEIGKVQRYGYPIWKTEQLHSEGDLKITEVIMELGGKVFLDRPADKNTDLLNVNGMYDEGFDIPLSNIEVTLHEENGNIATLIQDVDEQGNITEIRTNPTLTDENGNYTFKGVDAQKKYYVTFKISSKYLLDGTEFLANGQHLESTMYTANIDNYNTDEWARSSMASILDVDREEFNNRFGTIDSAPNNYKIVNKIFNDIGDYNKTYNIFSQTYEKAQDETDDLKYLQGQIIEKIHNYINNYQKYPDDLAKRAIYGEVANENSGINEVKNKIQYLVDIEVIATTGYHQQKQLYPIYNKFTIDTVGATVGDQEYPPIYPGQKHINLGVIEREKFDLKLEKDIFEIKVVINGKEHVYKCNRREDDPTKIETQLDGEMVELEQRGSDVLFESQDGVHNAYERDLRESDIQFIDYITNRNQADRRLRVFVTYKIRVTNQSNGNITGNVTKLRDYYDSDYLFEFDYANKKDSYISKPDGTTSNINWNATGQGNTLETTDVGVDLKAGEFFDIFTEYEVTEDALKRILSDESSTKENYAEIIGYKTTYTEQRAFNDGDVINSAGDVAGLVDRDSRPGDFEVTDEVRNFVNYSYTDEFKSKDGETKTKESLTIFQDDADKAPGLNLKLLVTLRELKGNVWEDKIVRETLEQNNIRIGNGQNDDEQPIQDLKVELIDINNITGSPDETTSSEVYGQCNIADIYNDGSFKSATTLTDANGNYYFSGYVPGDYLVRFIYGERELLVTSANSGKVYNAQDYKSTLYNDGDYGIADGYYWYEETKKLKTSDAVDAFNGINGTKGRNDINQSIASQDMTYKLIEILNYAKNKNENNIDQLVEYGRLWADTEKLVMEVEYTEKEAEYSRDQYITYKTYTVENVDFGLVERPRQELTVVKDVENVRIISNTGETIFDDNEQTANLAWLKPTKSTTGNYYSRIDENGFITATVDENLMHGSTVKILYKIIIENTGEKDYVDSNGNVDQIFYKTGNPHGNIVTNRVTNIVDYVENNLKFNTDATEDDKFDAVDTGQTYNEDWERVKGEDNAGNKVDNFSEIEYLIHPDVLSDVREYNTIIKPKEESTLYIELEPAEKRVVHSEGDISKLVDIEGNFSGTDTSTYGQYVTTKLFLTKVLDTSDSNDDQFVYVNSLEILSSRNQAGRRSYNNFDKAQYEDNDQITDDNMKFTIPGNYNPKDAANSGNDNIPLEADYDFSESLTVLVPFGRKNIVIIIASILVAVIVLGVGIVIIKKKVLKKDKQ